MRLTKTQLKRHLIIWIIIITYFSLDNFIKGPFLARLIGNALYIIDFIIVFYLVNLIVFPIFYEKIYRLYLIIFIFLNYCLFAFINYLNYFKIIPIIGGNVFYDHMSTTFYFVDNAFYFFIVASAGAASFYYRFSIHNYTIQIEREKLLLVKELKFVKNQLNSKITFNFLNFCYEKVKQSSSEVSKAIKIFTEMLHYNTQATAEEKIEISEEIDNIDNFINLQKLLSSKVYAIFYKGGYIAGKYILPRILITFVENAFKHGICNESQNPIIVLLNITDNKLIFEVKNKINTYRKNPGTHTGLENVRQILNLYYANNYILDINEGIENFFVRLELKL